MKLPGIHRNHSLLCTVLATLAILAGGCQGTGAAGRGKLQWIAGSFADGQVTMDLPGESNRPLYDGTSIVYFRVLDGLGVFEGNWVAVEEYSPPGLRYQASFAKQVLAKIAEQDADPAGKLFVWWSESRRIAAMVLSDGNSLVLIDVRGQHADPSYLPKPGADEVMVFDRMVDSLRLNDTVPIRCAGLP